MHRYLLPPFLCLIAWVLVPPNGGSSAVESGLEAGIEAGLGTRQPMSGVASSVAGAYGPPAAFAPTARQAPDAVRFASYLGGSLDDWVAAVAFDGTGNPVVVGTTQSSDFPVRSAYQGEIGSRGIEDAFVAKLDESGTSLLWSTYLGGGGADSATDVAVDRFGNVVVVGHTGSRDFPTRNPIQPSPGGGGFDAFVAVLGADGRQLVFGTCLGGRESDFAYGVALGPPARDSDGVSIFVAGGTDSPDFPVSKAFQSDYGGDSDAFVSAILPDRSGYLFSTYLGAGSPETARGISVDGTGAAHVTGYVDGPGFPLRDPFQRDHGGSSDAFVARLAPGGERLANSSYLGGTGRDTGYGLALDETGRAVVVGQTFSGDFPTADPFQAERSGHSDMFVSRVSADGRALEHSTYLGGTSTENGNDVAFDGRGRILIAGWSFSSDFPVENPVQDRNRGRNDAILSTLSEDGQRLLFSTFVGGTDEDRGESAAVAPNGDVVLAGFTDSTDFPTSDGSFQPGPGGQRDGFVVGLRPDVRPTTPASTATSTATPTFTPTATATATPTATATSDGAPAIHLPFASQ